MIITLLETAATEPAIPTIVAGILAFAGLMAGLAWVVGMGSGRPNSK
ncbi:MAG: hypothetical protein Q4P15_12990 [Propionibacteriaceae bacterium]|nr:hypothetical protein [Propionibacteriaceae bacterium]